MDIYEQAVLENGSDKIRLLYVNRHDADDAPFRCHLEVASLNDHPHYVAASYTWGAPVFDHFIECNGAAFAVTASLYAALLRFRRTGRQVFWVDQICINQQDIPERNSQVLLMRRIYRQAENVFIWLGRHTDLTGPGLDLARELASNPNLDILHEDAANTYRTKMWQGWWQIFESPWFNRCWIVQEVTSQRDPLAFIGDFEFRWVILPFSIVTSMLNPLGFSQYLGLIDNREAMMRGMVNCASIAFENGKSNGYEYPFPDVLSSNKMGKLFSTSEDNILRIPANIRNLCASDARDKVYSWYGLMDQFQEGLVPDYTLPVEAVYIAFTEFLISKGLGRDVLACAGSHQISIKCLPTWCMDLCCEEQGTSYGAIAKLDSKTGAASFMAGGEGSNAVIKKGPGLSEITLRGAIIGTIAELGPPQNKDSIDKNTWTSFVRKARSFTEESEVLNRRYTTQQEKLAALFRLLELDLPDFRETAIALYLIFTRGKHELPEEMIQGFNDSSKISASPTMSEMAPHLSPGGLLSMAIEGRRVCASETGYIGLVRQDAQVGDQICIAIGGRVPLTLRSSVNGEGIFTLVGDMFLLDMMNGDALEALGLEERNIILQ